MVNVGVHVLNHVKEEMSWAVDKWLRIISSLMLFKNIKSIKELKGTK